MLGSLEKRILAVLRREKKATARTIFNTLRTEGSENTYVTINTVLSRLHKRALVNRLKEPYRGNYRYLYSYVEVKDKLMSDFLGDVGLLFGEEGFEDLKDRLDERTTRPSEDEAVSVSGLPKHVQKHHTMRISISRDDVRNPLIKKIEEMSGQSVMACYQCGKCSAGCPMIESMDILPNQVIRLVQLGQIEDVIGSKTIWLCASCFSCSARCPKNIDLAKLMEALRLLLLRKSRNFVEPSEISIEEELPQIALVSNFRKMTG